MKAVIGRNENETVNVSLNYSQFDAWSQNSDG